jgi:hypothetical protein
MNALTENLALARVVALSPDHDPRFQNWIARVEDMLGREIGDETERAFTAFLDGSSVVEFVLDVKGRQD